MEPKAAQDDESDNGVTVVMEQAAQRDLKRVMRLVREGKLRVGDKTGLASAASMKLIEEVLAGGDFYSPGQNNELIDDAADMVDPVKSFAWPLLLQAAKLVARDDTCLKL